MKFIPEQLTVKANPALFKKGGGVSQKWGTVQSTVDMHFQNAHKTQKLRRLAQFIRIVKQTIILFALRCE